MWDGYEIAVACADASANSHIYSLRAEKLRGTTLGKLFRKEYVENHLTRFFLSLFSYFSLLQCDSEGDDDKVSQVNYFIFIHPVFRYTFGFEQNQTKSHLIHSVVVHRSIHSSICTSIKYGSIKWSQNRSRYSPEVDDLLLFRVFNTRQ